MVKRSTLDRRYFLRQVGAALLALVPGTAALCKSPQVGAASGAVRIASNPELENATLNELIRSKGLFPAFGVNATIVNSPGATGPLQSLLAGSSDVCLVSGYNGIIQSIEQGAAVKIVGGAMLPPAHAIYAKQDSIASLQDLAGKVVGVGARNGLLHALMICRLRKAGLDPDRVHFRHSGSNAEVYRLVVAGEVDAGPASISNLASQKEDGVHVVRGGELWKDLKEYTFQTAYASDTAIAENRDGLVRTLAAYSTLYRFLQSADSRLDFFAARRAVQEDFDAAEAQLTWDYIQENQPYAVDLVISEERINYLQDLNLALGTQKKKQPFDAIADMSLAGDALTLLDLPR